MIALYIFSLILGIIFSIILKALEKKDSTRYSVEPQAEFFIAMLKYFYDNFLQGVKVEELRNLIVDTKDTPVTKDLLKTVLSDKDKLENIYGLIEGRRLLNLVQYFYDNDYERFCRRERGCERR